MSKKNKSRNMQQAARPAMPARTAGHDSDRKMSIITFSKPEPILTTGTDYSGLVHDDDDGHYTPPINRLALAQLPNLNGQHGGILYARSNMVLSGYLSGGLTHERMSAAIFDFLTFGDVAIVKVRNRWREVVGLLPIPSLYMRRCKTGEFIVLQETDPLVYRPEDVIFLAQYDPQQQVYGLPDYIGGVHSALLNSEATIFRRRYYHNGAHMGGILYTNDPNMTDEVEEEIAKQLESSKGIGNFRTVLVNIPNGGPDGIKFIEMGDISAKDEFANIKNISAQDILNAHRFPAGLAGIIPASAGGLGDPVKTRATYHHDEVAPVQRRLMRAVNDDPDIPPSLHLHFLSLDSKDNSGSGGISEQ